MSRPKVFVSSTYYDLRHLRGSLRSFIQGLGYDAVLFERGDVPYTPTQPLDQSCYEEARNADIFVLIVGGRYGSAASGDAVEVPKGFFGRYESVTKKEYEAALERGIPIYIFVEQQVWAEYGTYKLNRKNTGIEYAHVESVNVFDLLDKITAQPRNNLIKPFDNSDEITNWLQYQWAGVFRDMLRRRSTDEQLMSLRDEVDRLGDVSEKLKLYTEKILDKVLPEQANEIKSEGERRIERRREIGEMRTSMTIGHLERNTGIEPMELVELIRSAKDFPSLLDQLTERSPWGFPHPSESLKKDLHERFTRGLARNINDVRVELGEKALELGQFDSK